MVEWGNEWSLALLDCCIVLVELNIVSDVITCTLADDNNNFRPSTI